MNLIPISGQRGKLDFPDGLPNQSSWHFSSSCSDTLSKMKLSPNISNFALGALLLASSGCSAPASSTIQHSPTEALASEIRFDVSAEELQARLSAAQEIRRIDLNDQAHSVIALDAAASGQVEICLVALKRIKSINLSDESASRASKLMSSAGAVESGVKVAQTIRSIQLQDAVMTAIASAEY
jgi:hypothetical protein